MFAVGLIRIFSVPRYILQYPLILNIDKQRASRKHAFIILTPLNPTFIYIVKLAFTEVYIIFLIFAMLWAEIWKI